MVWCERGDEILVPGIAIGLECAVNEEEAYQIKAGVQALDVALREKGFTPPKAGSTEDLTTEFPAPMHASGLALASGVECVGTLHAMADG